MSPCVALTRAGADNAALAEALAMHGVAVTLTPLIRSEAMDLAPLRAALRAAHEQAADAPVVHDAAAHDDTGRTGGARYHWAVFTSRRAVELTWRALADEALDGLPKGLRICAVGPATAAALQAAGAEVALMPARHDAEALVALLAHTIPVEGTRVLFPRALDARETVTAVLTARGAVVDDIPCYRTVPDAEGAARLRDAITAGTVDLVTLASGSAVRALVAALDPDARPRVRVATLGPVTTTDAQAAGLDVRVQSPSARMPDFADAIAAALAGPPADATADAPSPTPGPSA